MNKEYSIISVVSDLAGIIEFFYFKNAIFVQIIFKPRRSCKSQSPTMTFVSVSDLHHSFMTFL